MQTLMDPFQMQDFGTLWLQLLCWRYGRRSPNYSWFSLKTGKRQSHVVSADEASNARVKLVQVLRLTWDGDVAKKLNRLALVDNHWRSTGLGGTQISDIFAIQQSWEHLKPLSSRWAWLWRWNFPSQQLSLVAGKKKVNLRELTYILLDRLKDELSPQR